jgi:hypothetical protein
MYLTRQFKSNLKLNQTISGTFCMRILECGTERVKSRCYMASALVLMMTGVRTLGHNAQATRKGGA